VPLDQPFTYSLPETLRHRVQPGSRLVVPFGRASSPASSCAATTTAPMATRDALRLIDAEPVLDAELLAWAAGSPAITARRWAKCCAACCRWPRKSAAARSGR
jgi:primosomal protein N'